MGALTDLWKSERGLIAVLLIIGITVLAIMGRATTEEWRNYTLYIFGIYAGLKTITGTAQVLKGGTADPEAAPTTTVAPTTVSGTVTK